MTSFCDLPEDMLVEILSWLPAESVLRFKRVQKSWCVLIDALVKKQLFAAMHLSNGKKKKTPSLFFKSLNAKHNKIYQGVFTIKKIRKDRRGHRRQCVIDPSCRDKCLYTLIRVGFGHDPIANVYKAVKVSKGGGGVRAEEKEEDNSLEETIHSFDMYDETFRSIVLPDKYYYQTAEALETWQAELTEWNESVALIYYPVAKWARTKPIEVWAMHDQPCESHESTQCWTKLLSIDPLGGLYKIPITFWKSDELLMREGESELVLYNLLTKKVRSLHRKQFYPGEMAWFRAFGYVESFVSLTKSNNIGKFI
ncbi:F-box domain containing protein [Trema orientale]|uniref:F-box domain containing protein n=1 Tax=Trema orientale TaxID=63057 RepID=A0A2P5FVJ5_TREOI|nr:F-box domain containing protein [Trema orientale]